MVDFFLQYLTFQKRRSPHTIKAYKADLIQFSAFLSGEEGISLEEAKKNSFRSWVVRLSEEGLSSNSINRKLSSLRAFYSYQVAENNMPANPMNPIKSLKKPKRLPVFVRENNMKQLLENVGFSSDFSGQRDGLIIELLYGTGIRLAELIALKWESIDLETGQIRVFGKRSKERIIPLHKALIDTISNYRTFLKVHPTGWESEYLISTNKGKRAYPMMIERIVNENLGKVTTEKKKSPHVLRHTFATHLLNAGAEINSIKDLLGHSSLAATQVYTHNSVEKLKQTYKLAHPRARSKDSKN